MFVAVHALTPVIGAVDPRGLAIRTVDYCRVAANTAAERRVRCSRFDVLGRVTGQWDARLWALHEADPAVRANLHQVHSLGGRGLSRDSVDSGLACTLFGEAGQAVWFADGKGNRRELEYDPQLRPLAIHEQGPEHSRTCSERFAYGDADAPGNARGRLLRHDDPAGTRTIIGYALGGAVSAESRRFLASDDWPDWPLAVGDRDALLEPDAALTRWRHGPLGEVLEQTDAAGNRQSIGFDVAGQLCRARVQLKEGQQQVVLNDVHYDAFGQVEVESLGNDVQVRLQHRVQDSHLLRLSAQRADGTVLQDLHYDYDPAGNLVSIEDKAQPVRYFANQRIEPRNEYRYDSLYQLTDASGWESGSASQGPGSWLDPGAVSNYRQTYRYDAAGNLLELVHVGAQAHGRLLAAAALGNRCLSVVDDRPPGEEDFAGGFDANGNLLALQPGQGLAWDVRNQLREVRPVIRENQPDDHERYCYAAGGQRLRKVSRSAMARLSRTREVRYLPGLERRSDSASGERYEVVLVRTATCEVRILHWQAGRPDELAQDQHRYGLGDHLGSVNLEVDAQAAVISHEYFHPFGTRAWWAGRGEIEARYKTVRYSGKERDASGLYYYGARYLRVDWQRWLNPDPAGEVDGLNLYRMVLNNPLSNIDDQGREARSARERWQTLLRTYNKPVASIAPGIVRVRLQGGPELFKAAGFELGERFSGERTLVYLSVDGSYKSKIAALGAGKKMVPLAKMHGSAMTTVAKVANAEFAAFINGGFFNYKNILSERMPEASSIGSSSIDGRPGAALPVPQMYREHYSKLMMSDLSHIHGAPFLAQGGEQKFTESRLQEKKFQFHDERNLPGWLSHANHSNSRSGISLPVLSRDKEGRTRLAIGVTQDRGEQGSGYTLPEWAAVMNRLDRLNKVPGRSVNLDGGSSSMLGVVSGAGETLFSSAVDVEREVGNFIVLHRARK